MTTNRYRQEYLSVSAGTHPRPGKVSIRNMARREARSSLQFPFHEVEFVTKLSQAFVGFLAFGPVCNEKVIGFHHGRAHFGLVEENTSDFLVREVVNLPH